VGQIKPEPQRGFGLGYMFNSKWRAEFDHYIQRSRNSIDDAVVKTDIMLQFKVMYYLE
jgi:hypothetical protein